MISALALLFSHTLLQAAAPAAAADPTLPPATATVVAIVDGRGVQTYICTPKDNRFQWVFQAPEAVLFDPATKQQVGTHSAGPLWTWSDGSAIQGKLLQTQPSPNTSNIPWLLVEAHASGTVTGKLTHVTLVRRSDTQAGTAPENGCDATNAGATVNVPYAARYTFYTTQP